MLRSILCRKAFIYLFFLLGTTALSAQITFDIPPSNATVECDGFGNTGELELFLSNNGNAQASTSCANAEIIWDHQLGDMSDECGQTGSLAVTFIASDNCGQSISALVTFTIEDVTSPFITEPIDMSVDCDENCISVEFINWLANHGGSAATDDCSSVLDWSNDFPGGCPLVNETVVTFTATDDCGNSTHESATFYVNQFCLNDNDCSNGTEVWNGEMCECTTVESVEGCLDPTAINFDPLANCDDASCTYTDTITEETEDEIGEIVVDEEDEQDLDPEPEDEPEDEIEDEPELEPEADLETDVLVNEVDTETDTEPDTGEDLETVSEECLLSIPNAFSPNDDGYNDTFKVFGDDDCFEPEMEMLIYNRWGNRVFQSSSFVLGTSGWDGTTEGAPAELGAHVYKLIYTDKDGVARLETGVLTLIR